MTEAVQPRRRGGQPKPPEARAPERPNRSIRMSPEGWAAYAEIGGAPVVERLVMRELARQRRQRADPT